MRFILMIDKQLDKLICQHVFLETEVGVTERITQNTSNANF